MTIKDPKAKAKAVVLGFRAEIAAELDEAEKALPALVTAHDSAAAEAQAIAEEYRDVQQLLGAVDRHAPALSLREGFHRQKLDQAKSLKARALVDVEAARAKIKDLQRALDQIDRVVPPADEQAAA